MSDKKDKNTTKNEKKAGKDDIRTAKEDNRTAKEKTLDMKKWAVVGVTIDHDKFGYKIFKRLQENGYDVYPVNPKIYEIEGNNVYDSLIDIDTDIDVVDMVVNPRIGIEVMKAVREKGIKYVWLQPGTRSDEIREFAKDEGITIIEDCIYATLS